MPDILRAILLMVLGSFFFMIADMFLKFATQSLPLGLVTLFMGLGMAVVFLIMMLRRGDAIFDRRYLHGAMAMRCAGESIGVIGIIIALTYAPFSTVTALMQSLPLVLTAMGVIFLGEKVGLHRLLALFAGLVGVLIIIRPGLAGFDAFATFTLVGVAGMALRDFGTRIMPASISTAALSFYGALMIVLTGVGMMLISQDWTVPNLREAGLLSGLIAAAIIATLAIATSMRLGDVSTIAPFRYVRIVFGVGAGILVFGESLDLPTIVGSVIVVGAGLYSWMRERRLVLASSD